MYLAVLEVELKGGNRVAPDKVTQVVDAAARDHATAVYVDNTTVRHMSLHQRCCNGTKMKFLRKLGWESRDNVMIYLSEYVRRQFQLPCLSVSKGYSVALVSVGDAVAVNDSMYEKYFGQ